MGSVKRALLGAAVATVAVSSGLVFGATSAYAEVWNCQSYVDADSNVGGGFCESGFGYYRARVTCNSAHWPYTREIDGPVVYKEQTRPGPYSEVSGTPNGCHVVSARVIAL
jgi:hypothetical protein